MKESYPRVDDSYDQIVPHYDKSYTYYVLLHDKHEVDAENEH